MTKQKFKPMTWRVKHFDCNAQVIKDYDILKHREPDIKKMKKRFNAKEDFAEALKREMLYYYWSKSEHELIIEVDEDHHIWLLPWSGCSEPYNAKIDVTFDKSFDWIFFADVHCNKQRYNNKAKIDIYDQLAFRWQDFVDYCWTYGHKWQRNKNI